MIKSQKWTDHILYCVIPNQTNCVINQNIKKQFPGLVTYRTLFLYWFFYEKQSIFSDLIFKFNFFIYCLASFREMWEYIALHNIEIFINKNPSQNKMYFPHTCVRRSHFSTFFITSFVCRSHIITLFKNLGAQNTSQKTKFLFCVLAINIVKRIYLYN